MTQAKDALSLLAPGGPTELIRWDPRPDLPREKPLNTLSPRTVGHADPESLVSLAQSLPNGLGLGLARQRCDLSRQASDLGILDVEGHRRS
jgi:hypothetical protein